MKFFLKILFFFITLFQTNIVEAKIFVLENIISSATFFTTLNSEKSSVELESIFSENELANTCKSEGDLVAYRNWSISSNAYATKGGGTFFEGASYSSKVLKQMGKADDLFHGFPKSVDGFATKFGQWSTKLGADGKPYQWLKMPGSYGGKTGVFEFTKDANGLINHRFFNVPK